jgi:hypothetical protein
MICHCEPRSGVAIQQRASVSLEKLQTFALAFLTISPDYHVCFISPQ